MPTTMRKLIKGTLAKRATSRLVAIRSLVELNDNADELDVAVASLRLLGVSDGELMAALAGPQAP